MQDCLAVLNAGSSSIKFALYDAAGCKRLLHGQIEGIGTAPHLSLVDANGAIRLERRWAADELDHDLATREIFAAVSGTMTGARLAAVGHRVVHGGANYKRSIRVNDKILADLDALIPLAPLHQPHNLAPIRTITGRHPHLPQVACFDTAFHQAQPLLAQTFALPRYYFDQGVRRYGFHGLSYEYVSHRLHEICPDLAKGRVIIAHLGNGASLCAVKDGRSVASTMGFTAVDGLMMGTRCGTIDPGVILYLMDKEGLDSRGIADLVYRRSGLLGVSGISSDMRTLRASTAPEAAEAIALFEYRIIREVGSLVAALGGLDGLIFTAGIGEHDAATRANVMTGCAWLGLIADIARNADGRGRISADDSSVAAWVVPTDEEGMIAHHTAALLTMAPAD
ncbi:MAG: acetate/propionate family kinase [Proteobacteria bacterium]|nr:acetate/propionate family kinase [Pseudomonadota bacterium]